VEEVIWEMGDKIIIHGRKSWGKGEGEALVSNQPMQFVADVNRETGEVVNPRSDIYGKNVIDKVVIFSGVKGGAGMHSMIGSLELWAGGKPRAMINSGKGGRCPTSYHMVVGCYEGGIPIIDMLDRDAYEVIKDGDWVVVDGEKGIMEIKKKEVP